MQLILRYLLNIEKWDKIFRKDFLESDLFSKKNVKVEKKI